MIHRKLDDVLWLGCRRPACIRSTRDADTPTFTMFRKVTVALAALCLLVAARPILADGRDEAPVSVDRELALWAADLAATAMRPEPRRDELYLCAALADAGPAGYAALEKLLLSPDHVAHRIALKTLEGKDDRKLVPLLRRAFFELDDSWARGQALERLRRFGEADNLLADLVLATHAGPQERRIAIENLALLGPEALPALAPFLDTEDLDAGTLEMVAGWADEAALSVILGLQRSEDPRRRDLARGAIMTFATRSFWDNPPDEGARLLDLTYRGSTADGRKELLRWFAFPIQGRDKDLAFVLDAAASSDARTRQLAAAALEQSASASAESILKALLEDPSEEVRWQAAITLARWGVVDGVPPVLDAMEAGYRLHPPPTGIHCGTGVDRFAPAKSAMVRFSGRLLEDSAEGDASVWRQWWREVGDSFDPVEAQLDLWSPFADEGAWDAGGPSIPILSRRGDAATAARLMNASLESRPPADMALVALGRRNSEVATLLVAALAEPGQPVAERMRWLRILRHIDPELLDDDLAAASGAEPTEPVDSDSSRDPADLPTILGSLQPRDPEYKVRDVAIAVAHILGVRTGPGFLRELSSTDPLRRQAALFLVRTVLDRGWKHEVATDNGYYYLTLGEVDRPEITSRLR